MLEFILHWDTELLLYLNSMHNSFFDKLMWIISGSKTWIPLYLLIIWGIFRKRNIKEAAFILLMLLISIALADLISTRIFKEFFQRLRPSHTEAIVHLLHLHQYSDGNFYQGGLYGFVSSHAANTFVIASFSSFVFRNKTYTILFFLWASMVSYSRIYLGVHYPLDILFGALLGILLAYLIFFIFKYYRKRIFNTTISEQHIV